MKKLRLILTALSAATCVTARAELPAGWSTNLTVALTNAQTGQRPLLVYFTASWCGPCKLLARTTLTNDAVVETLSTLTHVAVDVDEHPDLAQRYNVQAMPTFMMLTSDGTEVLRATGYQSADEFQDWLTNSLSEMREAVARQIRFKEELVQIDKLLASGGSEATRQAAAKVFDLAAERDAVISQAAAERLKSIAAREPIALLDGLNHPRLATRIQVANALRAALGDWFDVDPWSDAAGRARSVQNWQTKLAAKP